MAEPGSEVRVVLGHDFAEAYGGAERTIATAAELYPGAPFFTILGRRSVGERMGLGARFHTLMGGNNELLMRHYRALTPFYPALVRHHRLPAADVLLTSSYAFAHGFRTANDAPQVCFCHSPLRFAWSMGEDYERQLAGGVAARAAFRALAAGLRCADRRAAREVTHFLASSEYVAAIIERAYGVRAEVVHPPVDLTLFRPSPAPGHDGFYLFSSRLIEPYKRPSLAVEAFRDFPGRLVIAGDGPAYGELRASAPGNVEFVGELGQADLGALMQRCAAVIFPSKDDFGLVPVEAAASGRPTIAYGAGGALETVVPGITGELFAEQTAESLRSALDRFDPDAYDRDAMVQHAAGFGVPRFKAAIDRAVTRAAAGEFPPAPARLRARKTCNRFGAPRARVKALDSPADRGDPGGLRPPAAAQGNGMPPRNTSR